MLQTYPFGIKDSDKQTYNSNKPTDYYNLWPPTVNKGDP